jgi:two-component system, NarL family, sensor histidine kinase BarA
MSYRAFKRLLGETSLERKCRFLFGAFILMLISGSFWLYAVQTESLAYDQLGTMARLLVYPLVGSQHVQEIDPQRADGETNRQIIAAMTELRGNWEHENSPPVLEKYKSAFYKPEDTTRASQGDTYVIELMKAFQADKDKNEDSKMLESPQKQYLYYRAIRATKSCVACHQHADKTAREEGDLIAVLKITLETDEIERGIHNNRAILITTALVTALLTMGGSYVIVRYVIVKPVKHLKEVSDAISAGELNVRSEIQTGDEFEALSHAFNRMLRNLIAMQDRLRKVNADLDRKVDELAQANLALYESNRLKSDFLATMSHELRTPLNSILGFSDVLLTNDSLSDKQNRWVRNIQSSGDRLLNLINDILDLARIEAGKMEVRLVEFSIQDVCEGLLAMFRPLAEKKNIDLRAQIEPGIPVMRQDVVKLQQIVSNLLSNAIKFTPEGGRVQLKVEAGPQHIVVIVTDSGVGIAREDQDLIFEKFRQAGNPLTREHAGSGLGLSIVRELAKLLGGQVTLQSELGRGSTFTVWLPLRLSAEPRLEFDMAIDGIDLTKAQRIEVGRFGAAASGSAMGFPETPPASSETPDSAKDNPTSALWMTKNAPPAQ